MPVSPPFATVEDIEGIWRPLSSSEQVVATNLLDDASQLILEIPAIAARNDAGLILENTLRGVTKWMVQRVLLNPGRLRQFSVTVDDATKSGTYGSTAVTGGDLAITDAEMSRLLGDSEQSGAFVTRPWAGLTYLAAAQPNPWERL